MECRFLKSLDEVQKTWAERLNDSSEDRTDVHLGVIVAILGILVEHELDRCEHPRHIKG